MFKLPSSLPPAASAALGTATALAVAIGGGDALPAVLSGGIVFLALAGRREMLARRRDLRAMADELRLLRQAEAMTASELRDTRHDLVVLRRDMAGSRAGGGDGTLAGEMTVLRGLLAQLTDRMLAGQKGPVPQGSALPPAVGEADREAAELLRAVQQALEDNRVDLYLQPIVSLPQRKVRFYECFSRIRRADGSLLAPEQYLRLAEQGGMLTTIDNLLLFRCVQLIRRLRRRNRSAGFFVNISLTTLQDEAFVGQFIDFLDENDELADSLFFEFAQAEIAQYPQAAASGLERLAALGYRFSLDQVTDPDIDCAGLARRGFRFVKFGADLLVSAEHQQRFAIHAADLKAALARSGIDLIAEKVEAERTVIDLLDLQVDYGQGWLFGEPRRSREEA